MCSVSVVGLMCMRSPIISWWLKILCNETTFEGSITMTRSVDDDGKVEKRSTLQPFRQVPTRRHLAATIKVPCA